jgi:ABC-type bacteriocin/lantibiotic exporter with double-glycine peptidase domain
MNEMSPLVLVFAFFFTSIALVIAAVVIWGLVQLKRQRMADAVRQLNEIVSLTNEALKSNSPEKQSALNSRIEQWDKSFGREVGAEIAKLTLA